jgi:hypothetical protein
MRYEMMEEEEKKKSVRMKSEESLGCHFSCCLKKMLAKATLLA